MPVTPFAVHHRRVTSGPNAIPTPYKEPVSGTRRWIRVTAYVLFCWDHDLVLPEDPSTTAGIVVRELVCGVHL